MKKFTKALLSMALVATMVAPAAFSASAAELTALENYNFAIDEDRCNDGFLDGNIYLSASLQAEQLADVGVEVNGKTAYWNIGYLGVRHCGMGDLNYTDGTTVPRAFLQIGIIGADLTVGENELKLIDTNGDTYTETFTSKVNALGTSYAKVSADSETETVKAEIVFNEDPGLAVGTTFEGRCHDDHNNVATFTVTAVDADTKMYTIEAENYVPAQSLLELKVTSEGDYKDYWVTATINSKTVANASGLTDANTSAVISGATEETLSDVTTTLGDAAQLTNGIESGKMEGNWPGEITVTFKTASAVDATYLVLYTGNDDASYNNRAPGSFVLYGSNDGSEWAVIKTVESSGMKGNANYAPTAFALTDTTAYSQYKLVITSTLGAAYFQMGELELFSGEVTLPDALPEAGYSAVADGVAYNGTLPVVTPPATGPETTTGAGDTTTAAPATTTAPTTTAAGDTTTATPSTTTAPTTTTKAPTTTAAPATTTGGSSSTGGNEENPKTGDAMVFGVVLCVIALGSVAVFSKKRSNG